MCGSHSLTRPPSVGLYYKRSQMQSDLLDTTPKTAKRFFLPNSNGNTIVTLYTVCTYNWDSFQFIWTEYKWDEIRNWTEPAKPKPKTQLAINGGAVQPRRENAFKSKCDKNRKTFSYRRFIGFHLAMAIWPVIGKPVSSNARQEGRRKASKERAQVVFKSLTHWFTGIRLVLFLPHRHSPNFGHNWRAAKPRSEQSVNLSG